MSFKMESSFFSWNRSAKVCDPHHPAHQIRCSLFTMKFSRLTISAARRISNSRVPLRQKKTYGRGKTKNRPEQGRRGHIYDWGSRSTFKARKARSRDHTVVSGKYVTSSGFNPHCCATKLAKFHLFIQSGPFRHFTRDSEFSDQFTGCS